MPPYWDTTIHAPARLYPGTDMIIDDLPSGSVWIFVVNIFISFVFQFIGFLFTYMLHTSHAAKYGSRAGLGLTLIQYGFYSRTIQNSSSNGQSRESEAVGWQSRSTDYIDPSTSQDSTPVLVLSRGDWLAFMIMTIGMSATYFIFFSPLHYVN